eukprot:snap_masked-scaffold348_size200312-processed-gene-0.0 protein:Tk10899 transcript:snap_masked-scaffold348_size200312-processed-gene-0.0-mRNA-1 annotation:"GE11777"
MSGRAESLRLFKALLRYGQSLRLTDRRFFRDRILAEFRGTSADRAVAAGARGWALLARRRLI